MPIHAARQSRMHTAYPCTWHPPILPLRALHTVHQHVSGKHAPLSCARSGRAGGWGWGAGRLSCLRCVSSVVRRQTSPVGTARRWSATCRCITAASLVCGRSTGIAVCHSFVTERVRWSCGPTDEPNFFLRFCADRRSCPRALAVRSFGGDGQCVGHRMSLGADSPLISVVWRRRRSLCCAVLAVDIFFRADLRGPAGARRQSDAQR